MSIDIRKIAFSRELYFIILLVLIIALGSAKIPLAILCALLSVIICAAAIAEVVPRLLYKKRSAASSPVSAFAASNIYAAAIAEVVLRLLYKNRSAASPPVSALAASNIYLDLLALPSQPEFEQTRAWFAKTAVGDFA
jgi:hypothetical protein